jgi:cell division protein FtsW
MKKAVTLLLICVAGLLTLGMVMLYSASMTQHGSRFLVTQAGWCGLGLVVGAVAAAFDYRWLRRISPWLLALSVGLLVLVLICGKQVKGARRWLLIGSLSIQPSELAKLALIMALAWYTEISQRKMRTLWRGLIVPGAFIGPTLGLIYVEPDRGTTILLAGVCGVVLLIAGVRCLHVLPPALVILVVLAYSLVHDPMRSARIRAWRNIEETKLDYGMQVYQGLLALGSGGLTGVGLGDGRQKLGYVPEHHTDFILPIIGEELGLVATLSVLLAFLGVLSSGSYIAWKASDTFGFILAAGITFLISLQAFINVAVVTNTLPNKGISLPFISAGGSNLVVMLAGVGLLVSIARKAAASSVAALDSGHLDELPVPQSP